jgi:hypothetical protein
VLLAGPEGTLEARLAYRLCEAEDTIRGVPTCHNTPFAEGTTALDGAAVPFDVPGSVAADQPLVLLGVACIESEPRLADEPLGYRCSGSDEPLRVSFDATSSGSFANRNPDLSGLRVAIDGSDVPLADVAAEPSCSDETHEVSRGESHLVELRVGNRARETLGATGSAGAETLQLSHFSTRGTFERQFSFIDPRARGTRSSLEWRAPARRGPVKQYLVVRDERGGVSWASVHLCVR